MDDLSERVAAVERALTDGEGDLSALADGAGTAQRVSDLEATVETIQEDVAELEAAAQALRGYVGSVRSVNEDVEQRADAAVAAVESLEDRVDELATQSGRPGHGAGDGSACPTGRSDTRDRSPLELDGPNAAGADESPGHECPTCGRESAAGTRARVDADGGTTTAGTPEGGQPARESLGTFDPGANVGRVTVQHKGGPADDGTEPGGVAPTPTRTREETGTDGGFLDRARELL